MTTMLVSADVIGPISTPWVVVGSLALFIILLGLFGIVVGRRRRRQHLAHRKPSTPIAIAPITLGMGAASPVPPHLAGIPAQAPTSATASNVASAATTAPTAPALRVFVSHSSQDNEPGLRIVADLRRELGSDDVVWFDASGGLHTGDNWQQRIEHELTERGIFVVLLSPNAMQSGWVRDEIALALELKNSPAKKVIVPVLLATCEVSGFLSLVQFVSFATPPYEQAFAELLFAVRFGATRMREASATPGIRIGPPMDTLPTPAHFVGRGQELAWVMERLRHREVISITTLNGLAGIGKTALAAEAITQAKDEHLFPDGIAVVVCLGRTDATAVLREVLATFSDEAIPEDADLMRLRRLAALLLQQKRALVVLDNVEPELQVIDVIDPLRGLGVSLLLTARATLSRDAVPVGSDLELTLLSPEKALELFATAYGRTNVDALDAHERTQAERIVMALGYHTLAVVLAARYALDDKRPLEAVAREMEDPQRALDLPRDETPEGVRRAFALSVEALPDEASKLFAMLAAFATPEFGRQAAVALAEDLDLVRPEETVNLLVRRALVDSTLNTSMAEDSDHERLRLHPLLYAYATYLLAQGSLTNDDRKAAHRAIARWYMAYANATSDPLLVIDEANITGALRWAYNQSDDALVVALIEALRDYWRDRSKTQERKRYLPWGIAAAERITTASQERENQLALARLLLSYGDLLQRIGRTQDAETYYHRSLDIRREVHDTRGEGIVLSYLGDVLVQRGDLAGAQANYERYLQIMREVGDTRGEGVALSKLGNILRQRGDLAGAQANYERYLQIMREVGDTRGEGVALSKLGDILVQRGDLAGAQANYERYLQIMREVGDQREEGVALSLLGDILRQRGDLAGAQANYEQVLQIMREVGDTRGEGVALSLLGNILRQRGDLAGAQANYERYLQIMREVGDQREEGVALSLLGNILRQRGDLAGAQANYEQVLQIMREVGDTRGEGVALSLLGNILVQRGDLAGAQANYERYLQIMREVGDQREEGVALSLLGDILRQRGDLAGAQANYEQVLQIMREVGDQREEGVALSLLGDILRQRGDLAGAQANYEQVLQIMREVGDQREEGVALSLLGNILRQRGDLAGAQANYERYLQIMREVGDQREEGVALSLLGDILVRRGDLAGAQANYERYLQIMREVGDQREEGVALYKIGQVAEARNQLDLAEDAYRQGLRLLEEAQEAFNFATGARLFGAFLIEQRGKRDEGCQWLQRAIQVYTQMDLPDQAADAMQTARRIGCADAMPDTLSNDADIRLR